MKTKIFTAILFILLAITYCSRAATVVIKVSDFPNTNRLNGTDLFLIAVPGITNKNITWNQFKDFIGTNPPSITIITNAYISNLFANFITNNTLYSTNIYTTNLYASNIVTTNITVLNEFHGKTTFIENNYSTNLFSSNIYATNIYTTLIQTNAYLFTTNIYISYFFNTNNTYVSNYFQTNVFQNTYMSNFFTTNNFLFVTNHNTTNLTVTNFYAGDTFVSNFFNTNVFVNNSIVSNFFTTNLYNTINIQSNYVYNIAWPLTNATLYGVTTFAPEVGQGTGLITLVSNGVEQVYIGADGAYFQGEKTKIRTAWFGTNRWAGPTNNFPITKEDQYYTANSDINITNISNLPDDSGFSVGALLTVTNSAATNITFRFLSSIKIPERTNAVVISNASIGILSLRYSPISGTQGVYRQF